MKIKEGFILKEICGEHVVLGTGMKNIDFNKVINLNESAAFAFNSIVDKDFTVDDLVKAMLEEYEVDEATVRKDCEYLVAEWQSNGIID